MKKFLSICALAVMAMIGLTSCEPNEDSLPLGPEIDYTATIAIKEATLEHEARMFNDIWNYWKTKSVVTIYEDYNYKYKLALGQGDLLLLMYTRSKGVWSEPGRFEVLETADTTYTFPYLEQLEKVRTISDITEHPGCYCDIEQDNIYDWIEYIPHYKAEIQPRHGYRGYFATEDGELKYIRLHITDYTLNKDGALETATVKYQLY